MCGIFGSISKNKIDLTKLKYVSNIIKHRGPDDEGYLLAGLDPRTFHSFIGDDSPKSLDLPYISDANSNYNIAFLHRRLSIIDLTDSGHQPMSYGDKYWIVLNGEIYNYLEIKDELLKKGYQFKSASDTEVVLASFAEWGEDCVKKFNGMWAFAIWDVLNDQMFISRDRLGEKPVFYSTKDDFIFCSEIKGILAYKNEKPTYNYEKLREYLVKGQIIIGESEATVFEGIRQLMPGHNLIYKEGNITIKKYWDININISRESREKNLEIFSELFFDSIKLRLRSDVEVGSCLSGGIDSSSIVSYASKKFNKRFNTFSAVWPGTRHDEFSFMKLVNDQTGAKANYVNPLEEDIFKLIDEITWHQEIPIGGSSLIAQWSVMKKAREQKVPVLLDGQGADEILNGYPVYLYAYINELIKYRKVGSLLTLIQNSEYTGFNIKKIFKQQIKRLLPLRNKFSLLPISIEEFSKYTDSLKYPDPSKASFLPLYLKEHIQRSNLPTLLHFEDRNSMAHSVEARVPFLDYRLVEFSLNIPSEQKIGHGYSKTILRDSMKNFVPVEILQRRDKIGFSTPIEENLLENSETSLMMESQLFKSDLWASGFIDKEKYQRSHLFGLFALVRFLETFNR